jgi:acylphosphatase
MTEKQRLLYRTRGQNRLTKSAALITVEGIVQRVGFRRFVERLAHASKITGYVQNMKEGTVVVFAQGEQENIDHLLQDIRAAKEPIIVDNIRVKKVRPAPRLKYFEIKSASLASEMQEGFGAIESQFNDYRSEFRSFAERTDSNFQSMDRKYGEISAKLTEILTALQTENMEAIRSLNRSVDTLVQAVEKISPVNQGQNAKNG